ncbi:MAG: hypothetical protein IKM51_03515, partial [Oscillospiraceae bacterium]|nr:hypothetical protein [Oscillospiraceae bacterium]
MAVTPYYLSLIDLSDPLDPIRRQGIPSPEEGVIDAPIAREAEGNIKRVVRADGKRAKTHYRVTKRLDDGNSVCEITLFTGRTHQIR